MEILKIKSSAREQMVEITAEVQKAISNSGVTEGICLLFSQHTTAGLTVNENADPDVRRDILHALRTLIPQHGMGFHHGEENSDSHLKTSLAGPGLTLPIAGGKLALGRWQGVFLCEFDGPRERKVTVTIIRSAE